MINFFQRTFIYLFFVYQLSLKLSATTVIYEKLSYKPIIITNKTLKKNISFSFSAFNRTFSIRLWPVINHNASLTKNSTKTPLTNMYWEGKLLNDSLSEVNGYIKNKFFEGKIKTVNSTFFVDDITKHQDIKKNKKNSHVHSVIYYKNVSAPKDNNSTLEEIDVLSKLKKHVIKKHNLFTKVHPVRTCELSVEVDHHFFADYFSTANTRNKTKIKEDIASLVDDYISFTNQILSNYSFEGIMGLHLKLGKLLISEDDICLQNNTKYKFCDDLNTTTYIDRFFNENHQNYCLALVITNKKIIPSIELMPSQFSYLKMNYSICSAALMDYNFQSLWFFNSAILNFHVLKKKNAQSLAFAHLVTHAFGAIHDTDTECKYLTTDDKNLMYPLHVHLGDNPDHFKISNCTIEKISNFLKKTLKYDPDRRLEDYETVGIIGNCLTTDHTRDFCGNQIVGPKEECDCGYSQEDCETIGDKCCQFPQFASLESSCTFKKNGICNPVKDACCNPKTCEKFSITDEKICNKSFECHQASICNGSSTCPENIPLLDYTPCQKGTKICLNGQCVSNPLLTKPKTLNEETDNNYLLIFGVILIITAIGLEDVCCNPKKCKLFDKNEFHVCRESAQCYHEQYCDGFTGSCPPSIPKVDNIFCDDFTKTCQKGVCKGSICEFVGLKDCSLTEGENKNFCYLACIKNEVCTSSFVLSEFSAGKFPQKNRLNEGGIILLPGSPCMNSEGTCDEFNNCIKKTYHKIKEYDSNQFRFYSKTILKKFLSENATFLYLIFIVVFISISGCILVKITPFYQSLKRFRFFRTNKTENLSKRLITPLISEIQLNKQLNTVKLPCVSKKSSTSNNFKDALS